MPSSFTRASNPTPSSKYSPTSANSLADNCAISARHTCRPASRILFVRRPVTTELGDSGNPRGIPSRLKQSHSGSRRSTTFTRTPVAKGSLFAPITGDSRQLIGICPIQQIQMTSSLVAAVVKKGCGGQSGDLRSPRRRGRETCAEHARGLRAGLRAVRGSPDPAHAMTARSPDGDLDTKEWETCGQERRGRETCAEQWSRILLRMERVPYEDHSLSFEGSVPRVPQRVSLPI